MGTYGRKNRKEKKDLQPNPYTFAKIDSKWIADINVKLKYTKMQWKID